LETRAALVTGSTSGLGFALAQTLAHAGCHVGLNGLENEGDMHPRCEALANEAGASVSYCRADVSKASEVERLIATAEKEYGRLDILVNNAVVRHFAPIDTFPIERWEAAMNINVSAAFYAVRSALPGMRRRNFGRIFNMASVYGMRGTVNRIDYVTSKAALIGMTRAIAMETLDHDITCHALCPGSVLTPGTDARVVQLVDGGATRAEAERKFLEGKQPTGRFISPDSVGNLLLFLCGPAGRDMTGAMLPVEGGWLAS
jgi:3-hydroxybutyrate dehydrogenase